MTSNLRVLSTQVVPTGAEVGITTGLEVVGVVGATGAGVRGMAGARVGEATVADGGTSQAPHVTGQASFVPPQLLHLLHLSFLATLHHMEDNEHRSEPLFIMYIHLTITKSNKKLTMRRTWFQQRNR